jgi:hypothetical protein
MMFLPNLWFAEAADHPWQDALIRPSVTRETATRHAVKNTRTREFFKIPVMIPITGNGLSESAFGR